MKEQTSVTAVVTAIKASSGAQVREVRKILDTDHALVSNANSSANGTLAL